MALNNLEREGTCGSQHPRRKYKCRLGITISLHAAGRSAIIARFTKSQATFYVDVREYHFLVESAGILSLHLLQAGLLLALYEFGHAIFPNAYTTIGHCARIGHAMYIHHGASAPLLLGPPTSWAEVEERSRVWWAVFLLDRLPHLGNPVLPFSVQDPNQDDYLPCSGT